GLPVPGRGAGAPGGRDPPGADPGPDARPLRRDGPGPGRLPGAAALGRRPRPQLAPGARRLGRLLRRAAGARPRLDAQPVPGGAAAAPLPAPRRPAAPDARRRPAGALL